MKQRTIEVKEQEDGGNQVCRERDNEVYETLLEEETPEIRTSRRHEQAEG